jgi:hypothetical protein
VEHDPDEADCPWCGSPCPDEVCTCSLTGPLLAPLYAAARRARGLEEKYRYQLESRVKGGRKFYTS